MSTQQGVQALVDAVNDAAQNTRSDYHLTLGELIDSLETLVEEGDEDLNVVFDDRLTSPTNPHSYRGYYDDLAFERTDELATVEEVLIMAENVHETELTGYKGGQFFMGGNTPLWQAEWGDSVDSYPIMGIERQVGEVEISLGERSGGI